MEEQLLNFGQALEAIKEGKLIARKDWIPESRFVFQRPADELGVDMVINTIRSLPQEVKTYFDLYIREYPVDNYKVKFTAYLCMKTPSGTIANGWLPSQADMLANDWVVADARNLVNHIDTNS